MKISTILKELNLNNGSNHKLSVLKKYADNALLRKVFELTYDHISYTFGMRTQHWRDANNEYDLGDRSMAGTLQLDEALDTLKDTIAARVVTGHAAIDVVDGMLKRLDDEDADVLLKVISRDLRINAGATLVQKVFKDLVKEPVYMRCDTFTKEKMAKYDPKGSFIQLKADGTYREFHVSAGGVVTANSRSGESYDYPVHFAIMSTWPTGHYFGELTVVKDGKALSRAEGNGLINSSTPPHNDIVFDVWDYVPEEVYEAARQSSKYRGTVPYRERFKQVADIIDQFKPTQIKLIESHPVDSFQEAMVKVSEWMTAGLEGGIWKSGNAVFQDGTNREQLKMKLEITAEVRIIGFKEGRAGTARADTFGSMEFETDDKQVRGSVSGFTKKQLEDFNSRREELIGQIMEVEFNDLTRGRDSDHWALSHPRFIELRSDRTSTDTLERIEASKKMAMDLK